MRLRISGETSPDIPKLHTHFSQARTKPPEPSAKRPGSKDTPSAHDALKGFLVAVLIRDGVGGTARPELLARNSLTRGPRILILMVVFE